jgi:poly(3-hydroxybutyrate) depolymerase
VFDAEKLIGTPSSAVVKKVAPGGHIGLFMGRRTLAETWPDIGQWIKAQ